MTVETYEAVETAATVETIETTVTVETAETDHDEPVETAVTFETVETTVTVQLLHSYLLKTNVTQTFTKTMLLLIIRFCDKQ